MTVSSDLKALRERSGVSMSRLAALLDLKGATSYHHYENEKRFRERFLPLGVTLSLLGAFEGKGEPPIRGEEVLRLAGIDAAAARKITSAFSGSMTLTTDGLEESIRDKAETDGLYAIAYALLCLNGSQREIAFQLVEAPVNPENASKILIRPYARILFREDDGSWGATIIEFPGCIAVGDAADEALDNLERTAESWVEATLERGGDIPAPIPRGILERFGRKRVAENLAPDEGGAQ